MNNIIQESIYGEGKKQKIAQKILGNIANSLARKSRLNNEVINYQPTYKKGIIWKAL